MLVCSILVLCVICAAEMANKDTHMLSSARLSVVCNVRAPYSVLPATLKAHYYYYYYYFNNAAN